GGEAVVAHVDRERRLLLEVHEEEQDARRHEEHEGGVGEGRAPALATTTLLGPRAPGSLGEGQEGDRAVDRRGGRVADEEPREGRVREESADGDARGERQVLGETK